MRAAQPSRIILSVASSRSLLKAKFAVDAASIIPLLCADLPCSAPRDSGAHAPVIGSLVRSPVRLCREDQTVLLRSATQALKCAFTLAFTTMAGLRANAAMLMHGSVPIAFFRAIAAGQRASFENAAQNLFIAAGPPRSQGAGRDTQIATIQIEPNALSQLFDHLFAKTGIGTGCAALRAVVTFFNAANEGLIGLALHMRM